MDIELAKQKRSEAQKRYYAKNRAKCIAATKASNVKFKEKRKNYRLEVRYRITLDQYNQMVNDQDGKCYICKEESKLFVDHNHSSNEVRKLLCTKCNAFIGMARENLDVLRNAITYIEEHN